MKLLIIGGGNVALEKLNAVLLNSAGTQITVVAPSINMEIEKIAEGFPNFTLVKRKAEERDIVACDLVIAAINDKGATEEILGWCRANKRMINVADTPDSCDFYLGSIVRKGHLKIAISTNGKSPTIAKRLKEMLEQTIPDVNELLENMNRIRNKLKGNMRYRIKRLNQITKDMV